ncbi:uncharacterized protein LOC143051368 [Mytilus galloprovincialis]|uniref:uncharacterized protein LOC143051368 n=1 Tax=Mytilus galloprovincialis TaxID=29158 RepID=UPI003F7C1530
MNFFRRIVKHMKGEENATQDIDDTPRKDACTSSITTQYYRRSRNTSDETSINALRVSCVPGDNDVHGMSLDHTLKVADSHQTTSRTGTSDLYGLDWSQILIKEDSNEDTLKYGKSTAFGRTDSVSSNVDTSYDMVYGALENDKTNKENLRHSESIDSPFCNDVNSREINKEVSGKLTLNSSKNDTPKQATTIKDALENQERDKNKLLDASTSTKPKVESFHDRFKTSVPQENQIDEIPGKTKSHISTSSKTQSNINWTFQTERKNHKLTERPNEMTYHLPTETYRGEKIPHNNVQVIYNDNVTSSTNVKLMKETEETETKYQLNVLKYSRSKENAALESSLNYREENEVLNSNDNLPNTFYDQLWYSTSKQNTSEIRTSPWKDKEIIAGIGRLKNNMDLSCGRKQSNAKKTNEKSYLNIKSDDTERNKQVGKMYSQNEVASQLKAEENVVRTTNVEHSSHIISAEDNNSCISSQAEIKLDTCVDMFEKLDCRFETTEVEDVTKTTCDANSYIENNAVQYQETIVDMSGVNTREVGVGMINGNKISQKEEFCVKPKINMRDSTTTDRLEKRSQMALSKTCNEVMDLEFSKLVIRDVVATGDLNANIQPPAEHTQLYFYNERDTSKTSHSTLKEELNLNEYDASTVTLGTENINSGAAKKVKSVNDDVIEREISAENTLNGSEISSTVEMKEPKRKILKEDIYKIPKENTLAQQSCTVKTNNRSIVASFESKTDSKQVEQEITPSKGKEQENNVSGMLKSECGKQKPIEEVWSSENDVHDGPRIKKQPSLVKANTKSHLNAVSVDIEMKQQMEKFDLRNESVNKSEQGQQPKKNISAIKDTQTNISPHDQISDKTRQKPFSIRDDIHGTVLQPCKEVVNKTNRYLTTENVTKPKHGASSCIETHSVEYQEISRSSNISEKGFRVNNENVDGIICQNHKCNSLSNSKPYDVSNQKTLVEDLTNMSSGQVSKHVSEFKISTDERKNVIASCDYDSTVQTSVEQKPKGSCLEYEKLKTKLSTAESIVQKEPASTVAVTLESVNIVQKTEKKKNSGKDEPIKKETTTENVRKPQKLILEIFSCENCDYQRFLHDRIGSPVKFTIEDIIKKQNSTNLVVKFPSKTSSRKFIEIMHLRNCEYKTTVKCHFYEEKSQGNKRQSNAKAEASSRNNCEEDVSRELTPEKQKKPNDQSRSQIKILSATQSTACKIDNQRIQTNSESGTSGYHAQMYKETEIKTQIFEQSSSKNEQKYCSLSKNQIFIAKREKQVIEEEANVSGNYHSNQNLQSLESEKINKTLQSNKSNIKIVQEELSNLEIGLVSQNNVVRHDNDREMTKAKSKFRHVDTGSTLNRECPIDEIKVNQNMDISEANSETTLNTPLTVSKLADKNKIKNPNPSVNAVAEKKMNTIALCQGNKKSKPQCIEIEIYNLSRRESNLERFLNFRLQKKFEFSIKSTEELQNVNFLSVEFPSTNSSRKAMVLLEKSNTLTGTYIKCHIDKKRKQEIQQKLRNKRLSDMASQLAEVAKQYLDNHETQHKELTAWLGKFTDKKKKFEPIDSFNKRKKEKETLTSKKKEMESQKSEFLSFIKSFHCKLEKLKHSSFDEQDFLELETSFKSECNRFAAALPIYACRTEICTTIYKDQTSVILGETGSGKSTQVVQYLYQTGMYSEGIIICTQPRKVAAISLATRVAKEMSSNVGNLVGYQVGMNSKKSKDTKILYVTDHVLLNECLRDPHLSMFSCIIIDEAHERSIFTDLLLGMIKKCLPSRQDLRLIVTSATIDPDVFVRFFGECPVLSVSGRTFPVDVEWSEEAFDDNYEKRTLEKAIDVHLREDKGDILVFLTSPLEVEKSCKQFEEKLRNYHNFICLPLHGKLQANEQQRVFNPVPHGKRKIVFATNSAETSITIPGIKYVVDSGRIKEMQFDPKKNISSLVVTLVTQSSANQRSGRAGRTAPGKCFRLYSESEYKEMNVCSTPEILRVNLGQAILKLMELGVDPIAFDFVESPPRDQLTNAMETLVSIGAVSDGILTDMGKWIAKLPFDPIVGAFIHDAIDCHVGIEALILTACCGSGGSLFYRSGNLEKKTNADKMKIRFSHLGGDVMTMLNAYREWHIQPENSKGKWCAQNYVNGKTIKAVRETATEVLSILRKELQIKLEFKLSDPEKVDLMLQKMIFKTFKHNICHYLGHERAGYHVIHKAHDVCLFPSSSLPSLGLKPEWLVIEQVLHINRDYGVNATPVPIEWIEEGLEEGWLKPFDMERVEKQKVKCLGAYGMGEQTFRDFVGPRYAKLKDLEIQLKEIADGSFVILDTDGKTGEICLYSTKNVTPVLIQHVENALNALRRKFQDEKSEQYLSSSNQGTRIVISAGCNVVDVLMPDEFKTVIIVGDPLNTQWLTEEDVRNELEVYGQIEYIEKFYFTKNKRNWGKVTFSNTQEAEYAVEETKEEEIRALPTGNARLQNEHRFRVKFEWCRRKSKGSAFVDFSEQRIAYHILQDCRALMIGGTKAKLNHSKRGGSQIFINNLNRFVNEAVLRHSIVTNFDIDDDHIVAASFIREKVQTSRAELDLIQQRLRAHLQIHVKEGKYDLFVKPPKDQDFTFLAFASFSKVEEGQNASAYVQQNFRPNEEVINTSITLQASILVYRAIFEKCNDVLFKAITALNKQEGIEIRHKLLRNGNCNLDMNCDHVDTLRRVRRKLDKIVQGKRMTQQDFPNIQELFTRAGKYEIRNIMSQTGSLIIDDYRILEISIYGEKEKQHDTFTLLKEYLYKLSQGINRNLSLKGADKPFGVIKEMFLRFGIDLGKMKRDIRGLNRLQINLRHHSVDINGTSEAVEKAVVEINGVIDHLREMQNCEHIENEEHQCAICFMETEDGEMYRLESCGHPFCKTCIVSQLKSAVGNSDFPLSCCKEGCDELWSWKDITKLSLQSGMTINNLVNRATSSYIARNSKKYKYCTSPECPSVYRVTNMANEFSCGECGVRICTACHIQYHDGISCDTMKELKEDTSGIAIWLRKDPHNRKLCPGCGLPIEKSSGCDRMECTKCRRHFCWVCLAHFSSSGDCYGHLRREHGRYGGGY